MKLQKVLVIGLRRVHIVALQVKFKDRYDIHCLDDQIDHTRKVKNIDTFANVISCTRFTNHNTERIYNRHKGFIRITGGKSLVANFLETQTQMSYRYT